MIARRSVWSQEEIQELAARFVPVADEVGRLQSGRDLESRHFQLVAEQGHYAGRTVPTATRQGTYVLAPSGVLLASGNSNDPEVVAGMLREALAKWADLPEEERYLEDLPPAREAARRWETRFDDIALVLRVNSRDLPRDPEDAPGPRRRGGWHTHAWNQDYAWFNRDDLAALVPAEPVVGAVHEVPEPLVHRLARLHLVDNVRGQTVAYAEDAVQSASLSATVTKVEDGRITLAWTGATRTEQAGDSSRHDRDRGFDAELLGHAVYDTDSESFVEFELVAIGSRWGATQYNGRRNDLGPAPMGIALTLASAERGDLVAPAFIFAYGW